MKGMKGNTFTFFFVPNRIKVNRDIKEEQNKIVTMETMELVRPKINNILTSPSPIIPSLMEYKRKRKRNTKDPLIIWVSNVKSHL